MALPHAQVVKVRNDHHHKPTTAIAKSAGRLVVETLNVAGMMMNRRLSRPIADPGMSGFPAILDYNCVWTGGEFLNADQWFASSKLCAQYGWKKCVLELSVRE